MSKTITLDGVEYNLVPKHTTTEPFICNLDGVDYWLGPEAPERMSWHAALKWCGQQGPGYQLPTREIMLIAAIKHFSLFSKPGGCGERGGYWTVSGCNDSAAWMHRMPIGSGAGYSFQIDKGALASVRAVRPVRKAGFEV